MDLPIKKPSMVSYADEMDFLKLLEDLSKKKHNGFIRVTLGSDEGYILFRNGEEIAASYDKYVKVDAIEKIKAAMDEKNTLIEVFDVKASQIDFLMDLNKPYLLNSSSDYDLIMELKKSREPESREPEVVIKSETVTLHEATTKPEIITKPETITNLKPEVEEKVKTDIQQEEKTLNGAIKPERDTEGMVEHEPGEKELGLDLSTLNGSVSEEDIEKVTESSKSPETAESNDNEVKTFLEYQKPSAESADITEDTQFADAEISEKIINDEVKETEKQPLDRSALMKMYGIKDIKEEDIENILESYKGGSISEEDVDKIELTLMNKIKKSIFGIPKIRGAEVMVFLDNSNGLSGNVNVIIEYESKGFLSRMMGESKDITNLKRQIINIIQIEIRKSFRKYPEIVDEFNINVEVN